MLFASEAPKERKITKEAILKYAKSGASQLYQRTRNGLTCKITRAVARNVLYHILGIAVGPKRIGINTFIDPSFLTGFLINPSCSTGCSVDRAIVTGMIHSLASVFPRGNVPAYYLYFAAVTGATCAYVKNSYKEKANESRTMREQS